MMNTLRMSSRSITQDICFERMKSQQMKIHHQKLAQIRKAPVVPHEKNHERKKMLKQLHTSKEASSKIDSVFDPVKLQNKALIMKIVDIKKRKLSLHEGTSLKNLHQYRSFKEQQQKKEIKKQNLKLISKILEEKSKMTTKKELRQQFKQYQTLRENIRKTHSKSQL